MANQGAGRRILVVDDEPRLVEAISMNLTLEGFEVSRAFSGAEAISKIEREPYDVVTLDVMMPEMDGFETLRRIRRTSDVPVIMLTVMGETVDRVRGLDLGADDYVAKPFSPRELVARIIAVIQRVEAPMPPDWDLRVDDDVSIDFGRCRITVRGTEADLRPTECRLLHILLTNAGKMLTNEELLRSVWGHEFTNEDQYVWLYITYLRTRIEADPARPRYILGERGKGYKFTRLGRHCVQPA